MRMAPDGNPYYTRVDCTPASHQSATVAYHEIVKSNGQPSTLFARQPVFENVQILAQFVWARRRSPNNNKVSFFGARVASSTYSHTYKHEHTVSSVSRTIMARNSAGETPKQPKKRLKPSHCVHFLRYYRRSRFALDTRPE